MIIYHAELFYITMFEYSIPKHWKWKWAASVRTSHKSKINQRTVDQLNVFYKVRNFPAWIKCVSSVSMIFPESAIGRKLKCSSYTRCRWHGRRSSCQQQKVIRDHQRDYYHVPIILFPDSHRLWHYKPHTSCTLRWFQILYPRHKVYIYNHICNK